MPLALLNQQHAKLTWCATLLGTMYGTSIDAGVGEDRARWQAADGGASASLVRGQHVMPHALPHQEHAKRPLCTT